MDWAKLDAALAAALADRRGARGRLTVLVAVADDLPGPALEILGALGARGEPPHGGLSATLSAGEVEMLSDQPWVRRLSLATSLRLHTDR